MTVGQQRAWERLWPLWGRTVTDLPEGPIDFAEWFGREAPVMLEIGSGMGEATSQLAAAAPELNYVAVEVYEAGLGQLMLRAEQLGVENLRLLHGDAVVLLTEHVAPESLSGVRIFYPDPWPKKRHHKRRIIRPEHVATMRGLLRSGGVLHCATDIEDYAEQMLDVLRADAGMANTAAGYAMRPEHRPVTKFERRGVAAGRAIFDLVFRRT